MNLSLTIQSRVRTAEQVQDVEQSASLGESEVQHSVVASRCCRLIDRADHYRELERVVQWIGKALAALVHGVAMDSVAAV